MSHPLESSRREAFPIRSVRSPGIEVRATGTSGKRSLSGEPVFFFREETVIFGGSAARCGE
jgi:hypothetical protein